MQRKRTGGIRRLSQCFKSCSTLTQTKKRSCKSNFPDKSRTVRKRAFHTEKYRTCTKFALRTGGVFMRDQKRLIEILDEVFDKFDMGEPFKTQRIYGTTHCNLSTAE